MPTTGTSRSAARLTAGAVRRGLKGSSTATPQHSDPVCQRWLPPGELAELKARAGAAAHESQARAQDMRSRLSSIKRSQSTRSTHMTNHIYKLLELTGSSAM